LSELNDKLQAFKALVVATLPHRLVTRDFKNLADRKPADLKKGIWTVLFQGIPGFGALGGSPGKVKIFFLGQFQLDEGATGEDIEAIELQMVEEVLTVLREAGEKYPAIPTIKAVELVTSSQMEHPYGWVATVLEMNWTLKCK
jgi:hypothetical protein